MKHQLEPAQIDEICAKYTKRSPKTFRERPVRNFLNSLPNHTTFQEDYGNLTNDARIYNWTSSIRSAISDGLNLAHFGRR